MKTEPAPSIESLEDWHVGATDDGRSEVRIVLNDPAEARAWAQWLLSRVEDMADAL